MTRPPRAFLFLLFLSTLLLPVRSEALTPGWWPDWWKAADRVTDIRLADHPYVYLPIPDVASPEPDQLRFDDLRGVACYPQPDNLQVCGTPDTTCFLLFTKSEDILPDVNLTLRFDEGLEYGGFAFLDVSDEAVFAQPAIDLEEISTQNPEAPSFLLSGIALDSGAVYICLGVTAECGADFVNQPPNISLGWNYTTNDGTVCAGTYTPVRDFGGNVLFPAVAFTAPLPEDLNLGNPFGQACHELTVTQTTPGAAASGYVVTASDYGFEEGIFVDQIRRNGVPVPEDTYTTDDDGLVTYTFDGPAGSLAFNETDQVEFCYRYEACFANIDFQPTYTVIAACAGEICSDSQDEVTAGFLRSDFPARPTLQVAYEPVMSGPGNDGLPDITTGSPYVFDLVLTSDNPTTGLGEITDMDLRLRRCNNPALTLSTVQVINQDMSVAGTLEEGTVIARSTANAPGNPSGTIKIDLQSNATVQSADLIDFDGDGQFDDLPATGTLRLRFTFDVVCTDADLAGFDATRSTGLGPVCQFTEVGVFSRSGCNTFINRETVPLVATPNFDGTSDASFSNPDNFNLGGNRQGYDFGTFGRDATNLFPAPENSSTQTLNFRYTLADDPLAGCPGGNASQKLTITGSFPPELAADIVFSNVGFDSNGDGTIDIGVNSPDDTTLTYVSESMIQFDIEIDGAGVTNGTTAGYLFDITVDTSYCDAPILVFLNGILTAECGGASACSPAQAAAGTALRLDPEDLDCGSCYANQEVSVRRLSTGFTDETRSTPIDPADISDADNLRFLPGDSAEVTATFTLLPGADEALNAQLNVSDWFLAFGIDVRVDDADGNFNSSDQIPQLLDFNLSRLLTFRVTRGGTVLNVGDLYSGDQNGQLRSTGLTIGGPDPNYFFRPGLPQENEMFNPAFPNGGYTFNSGEVGTDAQDGHRLIVSLRNLALTQGEPNALGIFRDAFGDFEPGDVIETSWRLVFIENPGQAISGTNPALQMTFQPRIAGGSYIGDPAEGRTRGFTSEGCQNLDEQVQWFNPEVNLNPTVTYNDGCDGEIVFDFSLDPLPAGWYTNEFRPIHGLEQVEVEIPNAYYYPGGATVSGTSLSAPIMLEPDSTAAADTAILNNFAAFAGPGGTTSAIVFRDAEFLDGVRDPSYRNFDFGEDDITTVGGTFPLLGVGGSTGPDNLQFTVPIRRLCGDAPTPNLVARYNWANKHLPDYATFPYARNNTYWDGKVTSNTGTVVSPYTGVRQFYFPFFRLNGPAGTFVNPHRSVGNEVSYTVVGQPPALASTVTVTPSGPLADVPDQTETRSVTITPGGGQTLGGAVVLSIGRGASLVGVTNTGGGGAINVVQGPITEVSTVFSFAIPTGLAAGEALSFDLETDLLFCQAAEICINPILGCDDDPSLVAEAAIAFDVSCGGGPTCYTYQAGAPAVATTILDPLTLPLCVPQTFTVQFTNEGTADLADFSPILFIPEGLSPLPGSFAFSTSGPASGALPDPAPDMADPETVEVFGTGVVFPQAALNTAVAANGMPAFNPGQVLTITFDAATSCDFTSGLPLVSKPRADAACGEEFDGLPTFGKNIDVALPAQPNAVFTFEVDDQPLEVSCSSEGDALILTTSNIGKATATDAEVCVRLPAGVDLNFAAVNAIVPPDFTITPADVSVNLINAGGDRQICFAAPLVGTGSFVCLELPFLIGDVPCGPTFIGATVISQQAVVCGATGETCTVGVSTTEMQYVELNVVPKVSVVEADLTAACTGMADVFDITATFDYLAESEPFAGDVTISLFRDVNEDGELDRAIDQAVGAPQVISVDLEKDEVATFDGTFPGVGAADVCPLLLVIESVGCTCTETVLEFDQVLPDFIDELGDEIVLCPGESFTFEGSCLDLTYAFTPLNAGTVVIDEAAGTGTITLNPGFGENARVPLTISGGFGACLIEKVIGVSTTPSDLDFGPYEYTVCSAGSQEVDLNIPARLQEDIVVEIMDPVGISNPNSVEPVITDLAAGRTYDIRYSFNDGGCAGTSTMIVNVEPPIEVTFASLTGCTTGFEVGGQVSVSPDNSTGVFISDGDGRFTGPAAFPGEVAYVPGPEDLEAGLVNFRFRSNNPEGACGPTTERVVATILLVDCGNFFWSGSDD